MARQIGEIDPAERIGAENGSGRDGDDRLGADEAVAERLRYKSEAEHRRHAQEKVRLKLTMRSMSG